MATPDKLVKSSYEPYYNLAQAVTEIAIFDYRKEPTEKNKECVECCLDVFYNFSIEEIKNIMGRLDNEQTEKKK